MGIEKTTRDIALEEEACKLNGRLPGTKMSVTGGGRKGPFSLTVHRLGPRQVREVIAAIRAALGEPPIEGL